MVTVMFIVEKLNFAQEFLQIFKHSLFKYSVSFGLQFPTFRRMFIAFICSANVFQVEA